MITLAAEQDAQEIADRLRRASGGAVDVAPHKISFNNALNVIYEEKEDALIRLIREKDHWYAQHVMGPRDSWLPLIKKAAEIMVDMGQGAVPTRWRDSHKTKEFQEEMEVIHLRLVEVHPFPFKKRFWEITANEVVKIL